MQTLKEEVKSSLIDSAIMVFSQHGYEKASMREIARLANTSVSNAYNYFKNKEHLFEYIVEPVYRTIIDMVSEITEESTGEQLQNDTILLFSTKVMERLLDMGSRERRLIVLLVEKSRGTRFETAKYEISGLIKSHIMEALMVRDKDYVSEKEYSIGLISDNYIDCLFEIIKDFRNLRWARENMQVVTMYHLSGIKAIL